MIANIVNPSRKSFLEVISGIEGVKLNNFHSFLVPN